MTAPALELLDVRKRFGDVVALDGASLVVRPGTVHALLGENGAGKTTLMRVAFGMVRADAGVTRVEGRARRFASPADAIAGGLGMVHQHFALVPAMTVAENVALGGRGRFDAAEAAERVRDVARRSGLALDPSARAASLSVAGQQRLEIVKALAREARLLVLDEPTAVLAPAEAAELLAWVRAFAGGGGSVVLITHKLREALGAADDLTVLRDGATVYAASAAESSEEALASAMLGAPPRAHHDAAASLVRNPTHPAVTTSPPRPVVLALRGVAVADERGVIRLRDATCEVRAGEIVGVAGVEGGGQRELLRALAGRLRPAEGRVEAPPAVGFVPEDRHRDAMVLDFTLVENVALRGAGARRGVVPWSALAAATRALVERHDVRAAGPRARAHALRRQPAEAGPCARDRAAAAGALAWRHRGRRAARARRREPDARARHPRQCRGARPPARGARRRCRGRCLLERPRGGARPRRPRARLLRRTRARGAARPRRGRPRDPRPRAGDGAVSATTADRAAGRGTAPPDGGADTHPRRWRTLALLALAELLGMSLWFAASAVGAQYRALWSLSASEAAWLTTVVQVGFVVGTAASALLNLADVVPARRLFVTSAFAGALANAALLVAPGYRVALVCRFFTGVALAGVYPPAMKMIATWFRARRGLAVGTIVGALTVGKATPYLVHAIPGAGIGPVVLTATVAALLAAAVVGLAYRDGPYPFPPRPFSWGLAGSIVRERRWRLATGGYLGHMWELYAAWTWLPAFIAASVAARDPSAGTAGEATASAVAFAALAIGGIGCVWGGLAADRRGRPWLVTLAMAASGACALLVGLTFGHSLWLVVPVALLWGFFVIADSAQFSVLVTESVPPHAVGTALTLQTSLGFLLTAVTIQLVPPLADAVGWRWAFTVLAAGPALGIWSIRRLVALQRGRGAAAGGAGECADDGR